MRELNEQTMTQVGAGLQPGGSHCIGDKLMDAGKKMMSKTQTRVAGAVVYVAGAIIHNTTG